jgi:hypothetical protein
VVGPIYTEAEPESNEGGSVNLILTLYGEGQSVLINWANVCYVESRGADGEDLYARIHFNVAAGMGALSVEVVEDIDDIASMLQAEGESIMEVDEEQDEDKDKV